MNRNEAASRIMVALDRPDAASARRLAAALQGAGCWMKVGMELFYAAGPDIVRELKAMGFRVFLDVKMHDIPNTVRGGARSIARLGADMFNVHAAGGMAMMRAALEGAAEGAAESGGPGASGLPVIIAVTQLTSTDQATLNDEIGIPGTVEDTVVRYARLARAAGLHGVVASPLEAAAVKRACGADFLAVTPGIRPRGADPGDQRRFATPLDAVRAGADFLVIGRPNTAAPDPAAALEHLVEELTQA
jgi:orotidine-5'-phosphate decarboxylase